MLQYRKALKGIIQLLSSNKGVIMVLFWLNWMLLDHRGKESERKSYVEAARKRDTNRGRSSRLLEYMLAGAYSDVKFDRNTDEKLDNYGIRNYNKDLKKIRDDWDEKVKALRTARMNGALKRKKGDKPIAEKPEVSVSEHRLCYA